MSNLRVAKPLAAALLGCGLLFLASGDEIQAASIVKEAEEAAAKLRNSKDTKSRVIALSDLGKAGQINKSLVSTTTYKAMLACLEDKDTEVRRAAALAVGQASNVADDPQAVSSALAKLLKDDSESVKLAAVNGLGSMGDLAKNTTRDLRDLSEAEVEKIRKRNPDAKGNMLQNNVTRAVRNALRSINDRKN